MVWKLATSLVGMTSVLVSANPYIERAVQTEHQQVLSDLEEAFQLHKWPGWLRLSLAISFAGVSWLLLVAMTR